MKKRLIENRYECLRKIGEGGMASVFEAQDKKLNRRVAVKILHEHMQTSGDLRQRFIKEAHAVSKLRHANILEIYDFSGESSPELWVVTELIDGVDLSRYLRDFEGRRIHPIIATCIVREISIALHESHSHGIIHRDIKPSNIMITKSGRIKLMDFGIAKDMATGDMTQTGTFMGSPSYMSPEQIRGITVTSSSDLYSLCVLFYELVTGRVPFKGNHAAEIITKIIEDDPIPPKEFCPQILPTINEFILKGLEKKTSSRFLNAVDVEEKLEQILKAAGFGDSRVEIEQLFRQPKTYQEKLMRLSETFPTPPTEEKTTEPKKIDAPKVLPSKPAVLAPPEPAKAPIPLKRQGPVNPGYSNERKVATSASKGLTLVLTGMLIGLGFIFFWVYLSKINPSGQVSPVETKSNRPPREATSRPPPSEQPPESSSSVSPNSAVDPTKNSVSPLPADPKPSPKNTDQDRDASQKPKAIDPQKSSTPVRVKGNDGGRVKPLPSEVKNVEIRKTEPKKYEPKKSEPIKSDVKKGIVKTRPNRSTTSPDSIPSTSQGSTAITSLNQKNLEKGTLTISATVEGRLLLNNKDFGTISSQERSLPLTPGGYEVKVIKEGFKTALGMAKIETGRTTKLLGLKLEKEKEKELAPLYKLILTTTSSQVQVQVSSLRFKENLSLSNSKKTLTLPRGNYFVKASFRGKTIERTILLPSPYDTDGTITFNAEFE